MYTARVRYKCFRRFEPGLDTRGECLLCGTEIVLSDLIHHWVDKIIPFLTSTTDMSAFQYVLMVFIGFETSGTLVGVGSIRRYLFFLRTCIEPSVDAL
jgi:hypothetical protein